MRLKLLLMCLLASSLARAQLPLSIEELLIDQDTLKVETSISHATSTLTVQRLDWIDAGDGPNELPRPVPRVVERESDATQVIAGIRYGLAPTIEINARTRYARLSSREPPHNGRASVFDESDTMQSLTLGTSWLVSPENETPALLLSVSIDAVEKSSVPSDQTVYAKTGRIGATIYKSIDPVVLSLALGYEWSADRNFGEFVLNPGNEFFILPQLNFAVNHRVTLIGGVGLRIRQSDTLNDQKFTARTSSTQVLLGLGFAPTADSTVFLQSRFSTGGAGRANLSLDWLLQF